MSTKTRAGLFLISFAFLFFAGSLLVISSDMFKRNCAQIPAGSIVGSVPLGSGGLSAALTALKTLYQSPLTAQYQEAEFQLDPSLFDAQLNEEALRAQFDAQIGDQCAADRFFPFLFKPVSAEPIELQVSCTVDAAKIRAYLENEIVPRYDQPPLPTQPDGSGEGFRAGHAGRALDVEEATTLIQDAICARYARSARETQPQTAVVLPVSEIPEPPAEIKNLEVMLRDVIDADQERDQITEIFLINPQTGESFDIARRNQTDVPPEIAFTAASTIKVPIMLSSFLRMDSAPNAITSRQLELMITQSKNDQSDWLMENIVGGATAPNLITQDLRALGIENTFLAGYFYLGAPLLDLVKTQANTRTDIDLRPDIYNQTTPRDIGQLLDDIYECGIHGQGPLMETFPCKITQDECVQMIDLLKNNHLPYLITAGIPDGVPIAHKHGWIEEADGLLHTMSNVAIVFSPNGDYILSIFTYHPQNLIFDNGNQLFSKISKTVYGFFNPQTVPPE